MRMTGRGRVHEVCPSAAEFVARPAVQFIRRLAALVPNLYSEHRLK